MKPLLPPLLFCLSVLSGHASSILWNRGFSLDGASGAYHLHWNADAFRVEEDLDARLYPEIYLSVGLSSGRLSVSAEETVTTGFAVHWVEVREGDEVGADRTRNQSEYFLRGWIDWAPGDPTDDIGRSDYSIVPDLTGRTPFYLGFATEYVPQGGETTVVYGWVELFARGRTLSLGRTAIDLSGSPLVAGQIPEPTSGVLALLGAVLLLFRRRNQ